MKILSIVLVAWILVGCASKKVTPAQVPLSLSVFEVRASNTITYETYPATIEGTTDVEIRPQVEGILKKVYADEGSYVVKGQPLFRIEEAPFLERLNEASAQMHSAEGALAQASLEVDKLVPLVENKVVSDHQLRVAKTSYQVAFSNLEQAKALVAAAHINLGYCLIKAPASGYISRLIKKHGSLISPRDVHPLTLLSDVEQVHVYFALAENDFIRFKSQYAGATLQDKIANLPAISLVLSDQSIYHSTGKVDMVDGMFDKTTGSITLRASFPNAGGLLRSGNTGRVRLPVKHSNVLMVPQKATLELQDKVFVYIIEDSNKVKKLPIHIIGKNGTSYLVQDGLRPGDRIVTEGLGHLQEGQIIQPKIISSADVAYTSSH